MKRGTKFILPVTFDVNLDDVQTIEFYFKQSVNTAEFVYPSETAYRVSGQNTVNLIWSRDLTYNFKSDKDIRMDTRITLTDVDTNPETDIQTFKLAETLFPQEETT